MDFTFTEEQEAVSESAKGLLDGLVTPDRVDAVERTEDRFDAELWAELARANLLGLAVPEAHGGSGLGLTELCLVLEQQGRTVAPVPLWATLVLGALPLAEFGTPEQQADWLPGVVAGRTCLSAALHEVAGSRTHRPTVTAWADGELWRLTGTCQAVPQAHLAARVLVPALAPGGGVLLALVDPTGPGATLERATTTDRQVHPHLHLDGAPVGAGSILGDETTGAAIVDWVLERALTGLAAVQLGICEAAVAMAAAYMNERQQFGKPLSTFQGAMLRAADAYIDSEAIRVTTWQAAWRLDTGRPATEAVAVAAWWASEAGQRVVHATQHLHGGMGADVSYPIHRYFLWGKQIELMLEAPNAQLARLGRQVVAELRAEPAGEAPAGAPAGGGA